MSEDFGSTTAIGGVAGGGIAAFLNDRTVLGVEGLYYHYDESISLGDSESVEIEYSFSVFMKLSFKVN